MSRRIKLDHISSTPDSHLQNPLRQENRRMFMEAGKTKWIRRNKQKTSTTDQTNPECTVPSYITELISNIPVEFYKISMDSEKVYGRVLSDVYNDNYPISPFIRQFLPKLWRNIQDFMHLHKPFNNIPIHQTGVPLTEDILKLYSLKQNWECIRLTMQKMRLSKILQWKKVDISPSYIYNSMYISQHYALLTNDDDDDIWLLDYDQIMMICDTIVGRIFSYIYLSIAPTALEFKMNGRFLFDIYQTWDKEFDNNGNDTYKLIKVWEPLIQGIILRDHDPLRYSNEFLKVIRTDLENKYKPALENVVELIESESLNIHHLGELHGIYRHWGHPTVNEEAGCIKVQKIAKGRNFPSRSMMRKSKAMFSRQFCISFANTHGRWPRIDIQSIPNGSPLKHVIEHNITNINFFSPRFSLNDWSHLVFEKEFEFDYHPDFLELCEDKALSPYLCDLPTIYAKESLGWDPGKPTSSRRILLEILRKENVDPYQICQKIMKREIPDNWKVILVHSKEREMKIEPRLFAMMVLEMRIYYSITESNISTTIFKYFPQQTMTLSENELTKRLYAMAEDDFDQHYLPLFMSVDFKSWNIHWQYLTTYECFKHLDDLFGTPNLYTYSHIFFQDCIISISSRFNPPEYLKHTSKKQWKKHYKESNLTWKNHMGGFEGIRQKGWTIVTIILLLIVELITGIKSYIIGQGDNQFLKLMIPIESNSRFANRDAYIAANQESITNILKGYANTLSRIASQFNLVIKTEESWFSSCIINYGKDILYRGAYLSQGMKRISRVMPDVNDLYPTLTKNLTSLQTTGLATAQKSHDTWGAFFICAIESILTLSRELRVSLLIGMKHKPLYREWIESDHGIQFILHGDTNCTGVPILNMNSYLYRGHPDPLTAYLTLLVAGKDKCCYCKNILVWLINRGYTIGRGDPELLINDPLSLNIETPPQMSQLFKREIVKKVKQIVKNKNLREVFRLSSDREDKSIYEYLLSTEPFYPRVLHELILQTVTGTRLYIISKFSSARTTQALLSQAELRSFYSDVIQSEHNLIEYWVNTSHRIRTIGEGKMISKVCPTELAITLRNVTWKKALNGKAINGVSIPFPLHQFAMNENNSLDHDKCLGDPEYILFSTIDDTTPRIVHERGVNQPLSGHKTRERVSGKIFPIPKTSRPLQASERLIQLYQWCLSTDPNMTKFITSIMRTRTDVPIDVLLLCSGSITSGSQFHRLNDHFTKRGVLQNTRPNTSSHVFISTDNMGKYSKGSDNMNLHFQGALLTGLFYIHNKAVYSCDNKKTILHMHYMCESCIEYIPDVKISSQMKPPDIKKYSDNPLIFKSLADQVTFTDPQSYTFKMTRSGTPSHALASLILSRILKNVNNSLWGLSQSNKVYSTKVSVKMIIDIGIHNVLTDLAILITLYFQFDTTIVIQMLCIYQREIWQDLGPACLLPENLSVLFELTNQSYQPKMFESLSGVSRLLSRALCIKLSQIERHGLPKIPNLTFYIVKGIGISRLFRMWSWYIYMISHRMVDIRKTCNQLSRQDTNIYNIPDKDHLETLDNTIQNHESNQYREYCWKLYPFRLSRTTPENALGLRITPKREKSSHEKVGLYSMRTTRFLNTTFVQFIEFPYILREALPVPSLYIDDQQISPVRTFQDHSFHLCHNLSSSYLKVLQILLSQNWSIDDDIICLADGEGSISLLLYRIYKRSVVFNTLCNVKSLVPHRAINAVPGEFINNTSGVKLFDLSILYGGDLLDDCFFDVFITKLPKKVSLITFDAEGSTPFTNKTQIELCKRVMRVALVCKSTYLIYKFFLTSLSVTKSLVSLLNTLYESIILTVPVFSSNETYEVYAVCEKFNPIVDLASVGNSMTQLGSAVSKSLLVLQTERIRKVPFQCKHSIWKDLILEGRKLGFNNSLCHHFMRLSDFTTLSELDDIALLDDTIKSVISKLDTLLVKEWNALSKINKGQLIPDDEKLALSSNKSSHHILDRLLSWKCNFIILGRMLPYQNPTMIQDKLSEMADIDESLIFDDNLLYKWTQNLSTLKRDYLRSLWVIWGHYHHIV